MSSISNKKKLRIIFESDSDDEEKTTPTQINTIRSINCGGASEREAEPRSGRGSTIRNITLDKIKGMLYALAIGDSLGVSLEFTRCTPKLAYTGILHDQDITIQFRFASVKMEACQPSDDTEMTLALLLDLIENKFKYNLNNVLLSYMTWANQSNMLGKNTRKLLKGIKTIRGYESRINKMTPEERAECQSNGSLMRASPLALLSIFNMNESDEKSVTVEQSFDRSVIQDTNITNKNPVNQYCNLIFVGVLKMLLYCTSNGTIENKNECKEYYKSFLENKDVPPEVKDAINDSLEEKDERNIVSKKGWVCNSFYIAFYAFWNFNSLESAHKFIIKDHPGSDTDTNASISSALFGAWLGFNKINQEELTKQNIVKIDRYWSTSNSVYKLTPELFEKLKNMLVV